MVVFGGEWPLGSQGAVEVTGITDNAGNSFALTRLMTSKFPLVVILAELALQMERRAMELSLAWSPREQHVEADALTNGEFGAFDPARRIEVQPEKLEWLVLPKMAQAAEDIFQEVLAMREGRREAKRLGQPLSSKGHDLPNKTRKLRETDPWN